MVLKLEDQLTVPGISKVTIEVNHALYVQLWGIACDSISQSLGTTISRTELNHLGHKVTTQFFARVMDLALKQVTHQGATDLINNIVQSYVKDYIPGVTKV